MTEFWRGMNGYLKFATIVLAIISGFAAFAPERGADLAGQIGSLAQAVGTAFQSWFTAAMGAAT